MFTIALRDAFNAYLSRKVEDLNGWVRRRLAWHECRRRNREIMLKQPGDPRADLALTIYLSVFGALSIFLVCRQIFGFAASVAVPSWIV